MNCGKCRIQGFWSLTHTRDLKTGYPSLCCTHFNNSFFVLFLISLMSPLTSAKCNSKSPEDFSNGTKSPCSNLVLGENSNFVSLLMMSFKFDFVQSCLGFDLMGWTTTLKFYLEESHQKKHRCLFQRWISSISGLKGLIIPVNVKSVTCGETEVCLMGVKVLVKLGLD